jgi:hypothetical protein
LRRKNLETKEAQGIILLAGMSKGYSQENHMDMLLIPALLLATLAVFVIKTRAPVKVPVRINKKRH